MVQKVARAEGVQRLAPPTCKELPNGCRCGCREDHPVSEPCRPRLGLGRKTITDLRARGVDVVIALDGTVGSQGTVSAIDEGFVDRTGSVAWRMRRTAPLRFS